MLEMASKIMKILEDNKDKYHLTFVNMVGNVLYEITEPEKYFHESENDQLEFDPIKVMHNMIDSAGVKCADILLNQAIEFCAVNKYDIEGRKWNCINYLLKNYNSCFTAEEKRYFKALNSSYMSIHEVLSATIRKGLVLKDAIEDNSDEIAIIDEFCESGVYNGEIKKGDCIAARVLELGSGKNKSYKISANYFKIERDIAKIAVFNTRLINKAMLNNIAHMKNDKNNLLLVKKMWAKDIMEVIYEQNIDNNNIVKA